MTAREVYSCGLTAGLRYSEMHTMYPGEILDYYIMRREYDMAMHGLKMRENDDGGEWD